MSRSMEMDKEDIRKNAAMEKVRLKAEYKRIMNECNDVSVKRKKGEKASASSSEKTSRGREGLPTSISPSNESKKKHREKIRKQEELDWIENEKIVVERKKVDEKSEKSRLLAEYLKIMNEQSCGLVVMMQKEIRENLVRRKEK